MNASKFFTAIMVSGAAFSAHAETNIDPNDEIFEESKSVRWNPERPWREPQDTRTAMNNPDLYAWQLFVSLNWPAKTNNCRPDKNRLLGDEGPTVWEAWRSREEMFLPGAATPLTWEDGCNAGLVYSLPEGNFSSLDDETVRLNRLAYDYIRDTGVYSLDEQERLAAAGVTDLNFPIGSKEVKAHWVRISEADKPRYHWAEIEREGVIEIYGLSAFHITSKDMPTWFWSTFEHVDNETIWALTYPEGFRGWEIPSIDSVACPITDLDCNQIPTGFGLEGTKWENYRLRGTQVADVDNRGRATVLTNSQIEGFLDQPTMSCVTCHTLAVKGAEGGVMPISPLPGTVNNQGFPHGYIGTVDPDLFLDENGVELPYLGLDYVWTLRNAVRENP